MGTADANRWIARPGADLALLVLTPLAIVPVAFLVLQVGLTDPRQFAAWVFALGAQGHHLPGWLRAYGDRAVFQAYRARLIWSPPLILALCLVFAWLELHALVLGAYLWGVWHALMQTYGVARIYGRFEGLSAAMARWDLRLCQVGFISAVFASDLRAQYILDLAARLGCPVPSSAQIDTVRLLAYAATLLVVAGWLKAQWSARGQGGLHPGRVLVLGSSLVFWWLCNLSVAHMLIGVALFEIFHDVQYLSLVWWVGRTRSNAGAGGRSAQWLYGRGMLSVGLYTAACLLYGAIGAPGEPSSTINRIGIGVLAASQLLHFYFDGFIWRLERPEHRSWVGGESVQTTASKPVPKPSRAWVGVVVFVVFLGWAEKRHAMPDAQRIETLVEAMPQSPIAQTQRAALARLKGQPVVALEAYDRALKLVPGYDHAQEGRRTSLREAAQQGALADWDAKRCASERSEGLAREANNWGVQAAQKQRLKRALLLWKTSVCLDPKHANPWFNLAALHHGTGDAAAALRALNQGLALEPDNRQARALKAKLTSRPASQTPKPSEASPR